MESQPILENLLGVAAAPERAAPRAEALEAKMRGLVADHYDFVWRLLRRLGLSPADAEDAAQQVFVVATRHAGAILAGKERSFLYSTAVHEVLHQRRAQHRRREVAADDHLEETGAPVALADELLDQRRARELLDQILAALPEELRLVFVLYEVDSFGQPEIANLLGLKPGTVASRLRRAREAFEEHLGRIRARHAFPGGPR